MTDEPSEAATAAASPPLSSDVRPTTEQSVALEVKIDEQNELLRQLMTRESDTRNCIQLLQQDMRQLMQEFERERHSNETMRQVGLRLTEISPVSEVQLTDEPNKAVAMKDLHPLSSDRQSANTKSVQTEQSAALEVEIDEQRAINRQLMTRESDMKHYVQLLQQELDKRSSETVVMAANMREMKTQLSDSQPDGERTESTSTPALEPYYIRENFTSPVSLDTVTQL